MNWNPTPLTGRIVAPTRGEAYTSRRLKIACAPQPVLCGEEVVIRHRHFRLCKVKEWDGHVYVPAQKVEVTHPARCKCALEIYDETKDFTANDMDKIEKAVAGLSEKIRGRMTVVRLPATEVPNA